jgi:hypothetical protein
MGIILNVFFIGASLFLIDWWLYEISLSLGIPVQILGNLFIAFALMLPFLKYNLKYKRKDPIFRLMATGIFKINACAGLPWIFSCIIKKTSQVDWKLKPKNSIKYLSILFLTYFFVFSFSTSIIL